ncbi:MULTISPECIES: TetR/AcrR family transcriptional regulator [unclassified Microbacterium]|uniref:TetR/AcrR family transcriptional regulator n=1 Tax=unclassified Microbacterium TaxID=2609290 RepID=UPI001603D037|nr:MULTISPECIES: TetR family transcriptional regulator [unclassified Microbacterium]MBT2484338.1 TetR/AcrR family transcriptional regulator [Microbacterium sp. ISL-108]
MVNNRRGRPRGESTARDRLMDAAQKHFDRGDLPRLSSRELAAEVGVSHTLVNYHFGSRDGLVSAAIALRAAPHDVIALSRDSDGQVDLSRLAHGILAVWEHPEHGERLVEFARRLGSGSGSADSISAYIENSVFQPLVDDFGREHARRMAVAIVGFLFGRYVLALPMFRALSRDEAGHLLLSMIR